VGQNGQEQPVVRKRVALNRSVLLGTRPAIRLESPRGTIDRVCGATVFATAADADSMVDDIADNCAPVNCGGMVYERCGDTWYQPEGSRFIVVSPPY